MKAIDSHLKIKIDNVNYCSFDFKRLNLFITVLHIRY